MGQHVPSCAAPAACSFGHYRETCVLHQVDSNLGLPPTGPGGCQRPLGMLREYPSLNCSEKRTKKIFRLRESLSRETSEQGFQPAVPVSATPAVGPSR